MSSRRLYHALAALLMLQLWSLVLANEILFRHAHVKENGHIHSHAHPVSDQDHDHTEQEFAFYDLLSNFSFSLEGPLEFQYVNKFFFQIISLYEPESKLSVSSNLYISLRGPPSSMGIRNENH